MKDSTNNTIYLNNNVVVPLQDKNKDTDSEENLQWLQSDILFFNSSKTTHKQIDTTSFLLHNTQPKYIKPKQALNFDWFFIFACLVFFALSILRLLFGKRGMLSLENFVKRKNSFSGIFMFLFVSLILICILVVSALLGYFCLKTFFSFSFMLPLFATLILFAFLYLFVHFILSNLTGLLFNFQSEIKQYGDIILYFRFIVSVLILPFLVVAWYYKSIYWTIPILLIITIIYTYKWYISWGIFRKKMKWYEFFLYFCSVELLPFAILIKFLIVRYLVS